MRGKRMSMPLVLTLLLLAALILSGCVVENSPAPGCVRYLGPAPMGGCAGKQIIKDIRVEPNLECLNIRANNCNGGVLVISNRCGKPVSLGGVMVNAHSENLTFDVSRKGGKYVLIRSGGNVSGYLPTSDERISIAGSFGGKPLHLEFVKTGPLCP